MNGADRGETYVYDADPAKGGLDDIVLTFDLSGNLQHRYLHGPNVDEVFADEDALNDILWGLVDRQGSVERWVAYDDSTQTTSVTVTFDAYGNITDQTPGTAVFYAYTGRTWDADTETYDYRARIYDAHAGSFLSEDPIGFAGGQANLSGYVGNSPTNYVDPSGLRAPTADEQAALDRLNSLSTQIGDALAADPTNPDLIDLQNQANGAINTFGGAIAQDNPSRLGAIGALGGVCVVGAVAIPAPDPGDIVIALVFVGGAAVITCAGPPINDMSGPISDVAADIAAAAGPLLARKADLAEIDRIAGKVGGLNKEQREMLHREISKGGYSLEEIEDIARAIKQAHPKGNP